MKKLFTFNLRSLLLMCLMTLGLTASAEDVSVATFKSVDAVDNSAYSTTYGGADWSINMGGNNKSIGFNNKNCKEIGDALGTSATATNYGIVVKSKKALENVNKISFTYTGGSGQGGKIYLACSTDGESWSAITLNSGKGLSAQGTTVATTLEQPLVFSFEQKSSAYYAIILDSGDKKTAAYRFDNVVIDFVNASDAGSGTPTATLSSIAVTTQPTKTEYTVGDALDLTGCVVTATYSDNKTANVTSSCTFSPANGAKLETAGTQNVSVSYENKTTSFNVTVKAASTPGGDSEDALTVTYNFNDDKAYPSGFPTSGTNIAAEKTFTISGNEIIINAPTSYYMINSKSDTSRGLFFGKTTATNGKPTDGTAYLGFPAKAGYKLTKVVVTTTAGIGGSIKMNIYDASWKSYSTEVSTTASKKLDFTFDLSNTKENTAYRIASGSSGKNFQFDRIVLTYEVAEGSDTPIETVATPTFTPAAGTYTEAQSVTISCATEGAAIYYTTDGKTPTTSSTAYTAAITVDKSMTIKAIAVKEGMEDSEMASAKYVINIPVVLAGTGEGTAESPFDVTRALDYIAKAQDKTVDVYVEGIISNIKSIDVSTYDRAQYYISKDGSENDQLYIFNGYYLNGEKFTANDQIKVGDKVVVCGKLMDYKGTKEMDANNKIVNIESSTSGKVTPVLKFASAEVTATLGEEFVAPALTNESNVEVVYSSSDANVATVDAATGAVTLVAAGTTIIKAAFAGNDTYNAAEASYTLNVEESKPVVETVERAIVTKYNGTWYAATTKLNNKKLVAVEVVVKDGKVYYAGDKTIAWAYAEANGTFGTEDGKYLAQSGTGTEVAILESGKITWTLETKGIVNANTKDRVLIYKSGTGFGNYDGTNAGKSGYAVKSELLPIATAEELAAAMAEAANVEITSAGYATYCPMFANVAIPANVEVYSVLSNPKNDVVALTKYEGTTLKQGEGVILVGDANTYTFAATADDATAIEGNLLKGVTSDTELAENTAYILANGAEGVGFYLNETGTIKAGKAYLPASSSSAAPVLKFVFEDANAIQSATEAEGYKLKANGAYNLAGQKVAADYKGIVIINGKKYLKK